jgi:hypothetical protein
LLICICLFTATHNTLLRSALASISVSGQIPNESHIPTTKPRDSLAHPCVFLQGKLDKTGAGQGIHSSSSVSERGPNACLANAYGTEIKALRTELRNAKKIARNVEANKGFL